MMKSLLICIVTILACAPPASAQEPACTGAGASAILSPGTMVTNSRPAGFGAGATAILRRSDHTAAAGAPSPLPPASGTWDVDTLRLARLAAAADVAELVWSQSGQTTCVQTITFSGLPPVPASGPQVPAPALAPVSAPGAADITYGENECEAAANDWLGTIRATADRLTTMLVFDKDGTLCALRNARPRQGDPIYVGIFSDDTTKWNRARITFQPCSLESAAPQVLVNDRLPSINQPQAAGNWKISQKFTARQCFDSEVLITVQDRDGQTFSYALRQASRYRATFHLGTVFSESHETTFGLRPSGNDKVIFSQGPIDRGPEYVAALVFYSLPRYFSRGGFHGRDPVEDTGWKDRFGGVIGVGLQDPTKRFITGFSFEVAAGVNILGVWDWAQDNVLKGVTEGSVFAGTVDEIPVQKEWRQKFVFGVSMDLVYAVTAFKR